MHHHYLALQLVQKILKARTDFLVSNRMQKHNVNKAPKVNIKPYAFIIHKKAKQVFFRFYGVLL